MNLIYNNFDTIIITYQGTLPREIRKQLIAAQKNAAKADNKGIFETALGKNGNAVYVHSDCEGRYDVRFSRNPHEVWHIKDSANILGYNIQVKLTSFALNTDGYRQCMKRVNDFLDDIGASGKGKNGQPKSYINRADYCFDFTSSDFKIDHDCILAHSRMERRDINNNEIIRRGGDIETTYIGKKDNRCLAIYNKSKQVKSHSRHNWWWTVWSINPQEFEETIWRFEFRIGKEELRAWSIKSIEDFEARFADALLEMTEKIRYVTPNPKDTNKARWKNQSFWDKIIETINSDLFDFMSGANKERIITCTREEKRREASYQLLHLMPNYMAVHDLGFDDLADALTEIEDFIGQQFAQNPEKYQTKIESAKSRFRFLG